MDKKIIILHLSLIDGVGPATIQLLVNNKPDSWQWHDFYQLTADGVQRQFELVPEKAQKVVEGLGNKKLLEQELNLIERHQIGWTTILNDDYPDLLKHIHLPPAVLYWHGKPLSNEQYCMAVVGSRAMNWYGKLAIKKLVLPLVELGWTIVSGGAIGADSCAHQVAVEHNGKTIVVLGSGLLQPYPASNKRLFEEVVEAGGAVVSPFPLNMVAKSGNFPARNRIIAGLSLGCLVVQAAAKSGAGITARFALEQGREVFAVPGSIDDNLSAGCHTLIKDGAKLVHNTHDILEEYSAFQSGKTLGMPQEKDACNISSRKVAQDPVLDRIMTCCSRPTTVDELAGITGMPLAELHERLFELQLQGVVCQQMGLWKRC